MKLTTGTALVGAAVSFVASAMASGASSRRAFVSNQSSGEDPRDIVHLVEVLSAGALLAGSLAVKRSASGGMCHAAMGIFAGTAIAEGFHRLFAAPAVDAIRGSNISKSSGAAVKPHHPSGSDPAQDRAHVPTTPASGTDPRTGTARAIDVSSWQPNIDWNAVHDAGISYAFMKASEGKSSVDPTYASKRAAANKAGIHVGAYDFARPGNRTRDVVADATAEAQHFLHTARIQSGDMAPVLDLEDPDQNLNPDDLALWVDTWLTTVERATGVKPLIYTSPSYWNEHVNDTRNIAERFPLWLAHWDTNNPRTPKGWQAWHAWQSGVTTIAGISGQVDEDWIREPERLLVP